MCTFVRNCRVKLRREKLHINGSRTILRQHFIRALAIVLGLGHGLGYCLGLGLGFVIGYRLGYWLGCALGLVAI